MGKHSLKNDSSRRNIVAMAALGAGAVVALPATAQAATVQIPNADFSVEIPDEYIDAAVATAAGYVDTETLAAAAGQIVAAQGILDPAGAAAPALELSEGQKIADFALSKQGAPYSWGATGPNAFDCSGLTSWAYSQVGKSIPRTSGAQASNGTPVSVDALQPGDIVSYYAGASHVAIYIGDGKVVQAVNENTPVQVNDLNYMPVHSAVRF